MVVLLNLESALLFIDYNLTEHVKRLLKAIIDANLYCAHEYLFLIGWLVSCKGTVQHFEKYLSCPKGKIKNLLTSMSKAPCNI